MSHPVPNSLPSEESPRLFALPPEESLPPVDPAELPVPISRGALRTKRPKREQMEFRACSWNDLLPADRQARIVWQYVESLDLSALYAPIKAIENQPGQPPIDPAILMALWLYATLRGIGSGRELNRRCDLHKGEVPFQWICGGVSLTALHRVHPAIEKLTTPEMPMDTASLAANHDGILLLDWALENRTEFAHPQHSHVFRGLRELWG
ncbi:MAG: transposase [Planctomycetaceae bacterium]|nr:transposase [Planctomycetaceae bacterium]